jgi:ribosomal protein S18 acetylase RimI-like enzyme
MAQATLADLEIREGLEGLTAQRIKTLYRRAPLHRLVGGDERIWEMFENASLVLTAWHEGHIVGVARVLSDGVVYSYLCDLAVEPDVQRLGVGRRLIDEILTRCKGTELILRDSDISAGFYERIGFKKADNAWIKKA